jgi:hypothetical protein
MYITRVRIAMSGFFAAPVLLHEGAEAGFFFTGELRRRLVVQAAQEVAIFFGKAVELNFAGLAADFFEFVQTLFVHGLSGAVTLYCGTNKL